MSVFRSNFLPGDVLIPVGMSPDVRFRVRSISPTGQYRMQLFNCTSGISNWFPPSFDLFFYYSDISDFKLESCVDSQLSLF